MGTANINIRNHHEAVTQNQSVQHSKRWGKNPKVTSFFRLYFFSEWIMSAAGVYHIREKSETPPSESPHTHRHCRETTTTPLPDSLYTRGIYPFFAWEKSHLEITVCAIKKNANSHYWVAGY